MMMKMMKMKSNNNNNKKKKSDKRLITYTTHLENRVSIGPDWEVNQRARCQWVGGC